MNFVPRPQGLVDSPMYAAKELAKIAYRLPSQKTILFTTSVKPFQRAREMQDKRELQYTHICDKTFTNTILR